MSDGAPPLEKILVANRGEIAVRLIRGAHELGIPAVAVFSEADRDSLHVRCADEAVCIGEPEPLKSYLVPEKIIEAARATGATAVHPGYGFLAENAGFAQACADAGLTFIGPSPAAIRGMGDKIRSRAMMEEAGVPLVPGRSDVTRDNLSECAAEVGFPLMLKASAGGGGKGIRIVENEGELLSAFERAEGEARTAFGDGTLFMERFVRNPHHIEIQILADGHGKTLHLLERECSVQRRHQKVVEEAPSPFMTEELRERMGEAAIQAAEAIGYTNAGTVEFLVDGDRNFYFLEMNTRLQVEHPITELITGVDIVREQILIAAGRRLELEQADVKINGHAIEVRVCAEDPENGFLPSVGKVETATIPGGPGIRLDGALYPGMEVSLYYDSMLGKLIAWGRDRDQAIRRLRQALSEFKVADLKTNLAYLGRILRNEEFLSGVYDTGLLTRMEAPEPEEAVIRAAAAAAVVMHHLEAGSLAPKHRGSEGSGDAWKLAGRRAAHGGRGA